MKRIVLIHTVKPVVATFEKMLKEKIPNIEVVNILDEFIPKSLSKKEGFEAEDYARLLTLLQLAEDTKPDLILATCSSLSMAIEYLKPLISIPVYKIDELMLTKAVESGEKITIIATAGTTIEPTKMQLEEIANHLGKTIETEHMIIGAAFEAMKSGESKAHDRIIMAEVSKMPDKKLIILAQASMAHLEDEIEKTCKCTVLSSPRLAVELIAKELSKNK